MEVSGALREPVRTGADLLHVHATMRRLARFVVALGRLSTKLQLPLEIAFQCLMQMDVGGDAVDFDKQHRHGNVPMHQAKVLDRNAALNAKQVEPNLRATVGSEEAVQALVDDCRTLRHFLRMKVEDGNDLSMARQLVSLAEEYLEYIHELAAGDGAIMLELYNAEDIAPLEGLVAQLRQRAGTAEGPGGNSGHGDADSGDDARRDSAGTVRLPSSLERGVTAQCRHIATAKIGVEERQGALAVLLSWFERAPDDAFGDGPGLPAIVAALCDPLAAQLGEKRSAILRAACDVVSVLCMRSRPDHFSNAKVREVFAAWAGVMLRSVHVTVGPIASACDATLRDVVVASQGAGFVISLLCHLVQRTTQAEQRRKSLGYIALAMVASPDKENLSSLCHIANKFATNSDDGTRRAARVVGILLHAFDRAAAANLNWDPKIARLAEQERAQVVGCSGSVEQFEVLVLKCAEPSKAALYHEEKQGAAPRGTSALSTGLSPSGSGTTGAARACERGGPHQLPPTAVSTHLANSSGGSSDKRGDARLSPSSTAPQQGQVHRLLEPHPVSRGGANHAPTGSPEGVSVKRNRGEPTPQAVQEREQEQRRGAGRSARPSIAELRADALKRTKQQRQSELGSSDASVGNDRNSSSESATSDRSSSPLIPAARGAVAQSRLPSAPAPPVPPKTAGPTALRGVHSGGAGPSRLSPQALPAMSAEDALRRQPERRVASAVPLSLQALSECSFPASSSSSSQQPTGLLPLPLSSPPPEPTTPQEISALCSSLKRKRPSNPRAGGADGSGSAGRTGAAIPAAASS